MTAMLVGMHMQRNAKIVDWNVDFKPALLDFPSPMSVCPHTSVSFAPKDTFL